MSSDTQKALSELFAGRYAVGEQSSWGGTALMHNATALAGIENVHEGAKVVLATVPVDCSEEKESDLVFSVLEHLASIDEAGLVPIVDYGIIHDVPFIAYERVDAEPLFTTIEAGAVSADDVLNLGNELLAVTSSAHAAGVWHGDLTPRNIIAGEDGIFLLGLGIQLLVQQREGHNRDPGKYTKRFLAPEVAHGEADYTSDQVSVAQVLRYAATGREPHGKIRDYHFDEYSALGEWIKKAIDSPGRRFEDIHEARAAFREVKRKPKESVAKVAPISAPPVRAPEPTHTAGSRLPLMLAIAAMVGLAWFLWPRSEPAADELRVDGSSSGAADIDETAEPQAAQAVAPPAAEQQAEQAAEREQQAEQQAERAAEPAEPIAPSRAERPTAAQAEHANAAPFEGELVDGRFIPTALAPVTHMAIANRDQGPLHDPLPEKLERTMERISRNDTFEQRADVRPLLRYARENRRDVRTHLVLARLFMHLGWYKSALERYRSAVHQDPSVAAADPRALSDLVRVMQGADEDEFLEGFGAIRAGWGRAALPFVQAEYPRTEGWKKRRAMVRLTRRLRQL